MKIENFDFTMNRTFVIAELSANHNHDLNIALDTVRAVKRTGANAIKLQTYTPDTLTIDCNNKFFTIENDSLWDGKTLYDLYKDAYTPWEWHKEIISVAKKEGLICFSSPFDKTAVDYLDKLNVPVYKIASFEIFDIPLIEYTASKGKPIIISTGIATLKDIEEAVNACRRVGNNDIALLKCTSAYPAPIEEANLLTIPNLKETFDVTVGLSDHTMGHSVAIAAVALGAKIIEKHFILDRSIGGPDASFSMEPKEFKEMVDSIREVEKALGKINYSLTPKVEKSRIFARSLFVVENVKIGDKLSGKNVRSIRPGYGLHPKYFDKIMGKTFTKNVERGMPLEWGMFE